MAGNELNPGHCFGILVWLGAIRVDETVPADPGEQGTIRSLLNLKTREEKATRTELELGGQPPEEAMAFASLLNALYLAWVHDVPVFISP
jgi:hypothetical protein